MRVTRIPKLKLLVGAMVLAVAAPVALAKDWKDRSHHRSYRVTVVRERVVAPQTVRHIYQPAPPPHVVVHRAPARVVQYEERPVYVEPPPRTVVHTEYRQGWTGEVDIDSLKPELRFDRRDGQWWLEVRYDVEVKYGPNGQFDLVVELLEHGAPLIDERGEPVSFAVVLDRPTDVDDDELEYKSRFDAPLPAGLAFHPKNLKAHALVVDRQTGDVLDTKREKVDLDD